MTHLLRSLATGAAAGAAGTTALNAVTYLDMAVRGRPTSSTPEDTVEAAAAAMGVAIPGDDDTRQNRLAGLGPLTGIATGVGVGALGALLLHGRRAPFVIAAPLLGAGAMLASNGGMTAFGVTDPRTWAAADWVADIVPHLAYGAVTAAVLSAVDDRVTVAVEAPARARWSSR